MRKKREYKKRKLKLPDQRMQPSIPIASRPLTLQQHGGAPSYTSLADVSTPVATPVTAYSSDEENLSPVSLSVLCVVNFVLLSACLAVFYCEERQAWYKYQI